jgi:cation diffusion facilitator family transporter
MSLAGRFEYPPEQQATRAKAVRVAWFSIALLTSAAIGLGLTLGQSQAMKTAWASDLLSVIPPIGFLVAMRYETRDPTPRFPYGYTRAISIAFLLTASTLSLFGVMLCGDAILKLVRGDRPPIGSVVIAGHQIWAGWTMIAALAYSMGCGLLVGSLKTPIARTLHDKELDAEAQMNRDEWMSEGVAILGLLLVAFGWWWGDAVSAALVSVQILRDGWNNVRQVIGDLMDEAPSVMSTHELDDLPARVQRAAEALEWVEHASVRLREHGRAIVGEVFVVPRDGSDLVPCIDAAAAELRRVDWRLHALTIMPVRELRTGPDG